MDHPPLLGIGKGLRQRAGMLLDRFQGSRGAG